MQSDVQMESVQSHWFDPPPFEFDPPFVRDPGFGDFSNYSYHDIFLYFGARRRREKNGIWVLFTRENIGLYYKISFFSPAALFTV